MKIKHKDYLTYEIPNNWTMQENDDYSTVSIFDNENGVGALTMSFITVFRPRDVYNDYIYSMAVQHVEQFKIVLKQPLIYNTNNKDKIIVSGIGYEDFGFEKLWFIGKYPKIVMATYLSDEETPEVEIVDKIIDSFRFAKWM